MYRLSCKYFAQVCCHTFDGIGYLEDLRKGLAEALVSAGFGGVTVRPDTKETNSRERKDLPVELEVLAEGEKEALLRETEKAMSAVSGKYHLSMTVFSRSVEEI